MLRKTYELVTKHLPYNEQEVIRINREGSFTNDQKVSLGAYINKGGICRHQALLTGYLLEKMVQDGKLPGKVSIDRNSIPNQGGHAWVRYEEPGKPNTNTVSIIDPAQGYVGRLSDVPTDAWFYSRPTDKKRP